MPVACSSDSEAFVIGFPLIQIRDARCPGIQSVVVCPMIMMFVIRLGIITLGITGTATAAAAPARNILLVVIINPFQLCFYYSGNIPKNKFEYSIIFQFLCDGLSTLGWGGVPLVVHRLV